MKHTKGLNFHLSQEEFQIRNLLNVKFTMNISKSYLLIIVNFSYI